MQTRIEADGDGTLRTYDGEVAATYQAKYSYDFASMVGMWDPFQFMSLTPITDVFVKLWA